MAFAKIKYLTHLSSVTDEIEKLAQAQAFVDLKIVCCDGSLLTHRSVLAGSSPFLKEVLTSLNDQDVDDVTTLILPEISSSVVGTLLALLYSGKANLFKSEIESLTELTQILKLKSFPVTVSEQKWTNNDPELRQEVSTAKNGQRTPKICRRQTPRSSAVESGTTTTPTSTPTRSPTILSTQTTRSGRVVVHKRFVDELVERDDVATSSAVSSRTSNNSIKILKRESSESVRRTSDTIGTTFSTDGTSKKPKEQTRDLTATEDPGASCVTENRLVRICVICSKRNLGRNAHGKHMKTSHPKELGPYPCPVVDCGRSVESGLKMMQHMHTHVGPRARALAEGRRFSCQDCSAVYTTLSRLNEHRRKKHGATSSTTDAKFTCNAQLTSETTEESSPCDLKFSTARLFADHMTKVHGLNPWLCKVCLKRFKEKQNYEYHLMQHEGYKSFECDVCQKSFSNPRQLYSHRSLHLGRRFLCSECGFRARSSANLRGHVKSKHEAKQLECSFCLKKFASGNNLRNHVRIHTGETPYECQLCGVKFKRVHHLHSHTESKQHAEAVEKAAKKGVEIPDHLDPEKRRRRRNSINVGSVVAIDNVSDDNRHVNQQQQPNEGPSAESWPKELILMSEKSGNLHGFIIPMEASSVQVIQTTHDGQILIPVQLEPTSTPCSS